MKISKNKIFSFIVLLLTGIGIQFSFGQQKNNLSKKSKHEVSKHTYGKHVVKKHSGHKEEVEDENERYDGIVAAQQQEFNMTHDPSTNTVPKTRLFNALAQRNELISQTISDRAINPFVTNASSIAINNINWVERGPNSDFAGTGSSANPRDNNAITSGRMTALWNDVDPSKPNQVFVGGIDGGLWTCPDITISTPAWTFIDNFSNLAIASICQDPNNYNIMYFGTGEHTINSDAVQGGGVWKSTDHGATWSLLSNTTSFYNVSKILCDKKSNVYVATSFYCCGSNGAGLLRSVNQGTSWVDVTPTVGSLNTKQISDIAYDPINDKMGVFVGYYPYSTGTYAGYCYGTPSSVTSSTWSTPTTANGSGMAISTQGLTNQLYQTILCVKNGVVWALKGAFNYNTSADYMLLYRSLDGGATWTRQDSITNSIYGAGQAWYSIGMDCDPANPSTNVIIGGLNVFKSTNGGVSFTQMSEWVTGANTGAPAQYVHADVHNIYYGTSRVLVCSDGGIFYSADVGSTWRDRNAGLRIKQFYSCAIHPTTADYFLAGAQDNGSHQFTHAGLGATVEVTGGDGAFVAIDQATPTNQFTSYIYNAYYVSLNGGSTWTSRTLSSSAGQFINPFDFDSQTKKLYAAYTAGNYVRWDNPTVAATPSRSTISVSSVVGANILTAVTVSPNVSNTIYVAANSSTASFVAKVTNANAVTPTLPTVTNITPPTITAGSYISSIILGPSTTDQDIIVTVSSYGSKKVFITANGGTTWTEITGNLPDMPVRWAMYYPGGNTQVLLATESGVWYTTAVNGASTAWLPSVGFPAVRTDMIKYCSATGVNNGVVAAATHGRGLFSSQLNSIALPVTLTLFTGNLNAENHTVLNWETATEINSKNFIIEKSTDGSSFLDIGTVAASGNTASPKSYTFTDPQLADKIDYYRLKMVDKDASFLYSKIVVVSNASNFNKDVRIATNPFNKYIDVYFTKIPTGKVGFVLVDAQGRMVMQLSTPISSNNYRIDLGNKLLSAGRYSLQIMIDQQPVNFNLIKANN